MHSCRPAADGSARKAQEPPPIFAPPVRTWLASLLAQPSYSHAACLHGYCMLSCRTSAVQRFSRACVIATAATAAYFSEGYPAHHTDRPS